MPSTLRVATANVYQALPRAVAREVLHTVLATEPDVVGLQEWYAVRRDLLPRDRIRWRAPLLGGCVVGVRRDRLAALDGRTVWLSRPGRADRGEGRFGVEPGRAATVVRCRERATGALVSAICYHLVSGVQSQDRYREDRPVLVGRHRAEAERLGRLVEVERRAGYAVLAMGDSNFHGFALAGLTSSWSGADRRGTHGPRRQIDDVLGTGLVGDVRLLETASDHRALVVERHL